MEINKLYLGDCLEIMPNTIDDKSVDLILCDLPYGTTNCKWDTIIDLNKLWVEYKRVIKPNGAILLFAQTPFDKVLGSSNLGMLRYEWIWEKTQATGHLNAKKMPMKSHENILVFYNKKPTYNPQKTTGHKPINSYTKYVKTQNNTEIYGKVKKEISGGGETDRYPRSVLKFPSDKQTSCLHSTQKPLALCEYFIKTYTNEGDLVLDNTAGSGTTGLAAKNLNRNYILIEKDETYFKVIEERLK
jgi:site-specific DNA-methyltransferase (adenine-specific)